MTLLMILDQTMHILPTPKELINQIPLSLSEKGFVLKCREQIISILAHEDPRLLLIVGPCSIHDSLATLDYAMRLKELAKEVEDSFLIVMRTYFEKPRTALGWRGFLHDPFLDSSHHIHEGLIKTRQLLKELTALGIPLATEFLDPATPYYFSDAISWGCVGARTVSSPIHRQMASHLDLPIAFKNSTDGTIESALYAIEVARKPHTFIGMNQDGKLSLIHSRGNPHAHLVLRGGEREPNYDELFIERSLSETSHLLVDCSHDNSRKKPVQQIEVFNEVLRQVLQGRSGIRGMMLESFLLEGNQPLSAHLKYGISVTDPCLNFETTQQLIRKGTERLQPCVLLNRVL